ncbi:MAG: phosphoribosylamine--glycine ligase, partial [Chloroflexi bacterium]|nr:phosphoribosylamine--glycine ligase [Chloroflexota bacterium]
CDGTDVLALPAARDHKRLEDGDRGPNTGGMGAFSPVPDLPDDEAGGLLERIHRPILAELARRGSPFRGALYAGLMLTEDGPVLLECNARFGDPETQVVVPRLAVALGPLLLAAAGGNLRRAARSLRLAGTHLPVRPDATVGVVLAAGGYPLTSRAGDQIDGLDAAAATGALIFHGGTAIGPGGRFITAGGRILTIVGRGADLEAARQHADSSADLIRFPGAVRRRDIGLAAGPVDLGAGAGAVTTAADDRRVAS